MSGKTPTFVGLYFLGGGSWTRIAEYRLTSDGRVDFFEYSNGTTIGRQWYENGVEILGEKRLVHAEDDGSTFMKALLQPFRMSYYQFRDDSPENHADDVFMITFEGGDRGIYKPIVDTNVNVPAGIPGGMAEREVAASRVDEFLGFGLVPTTAIVDAAYGLGSAQLWVDSTDSKAVHEYPVRQQEQLAVLDYIIGNTDRQPRTYRTNATGGIVAVDNGSCFPVSLAGRADIRSDFVEARLNTPLGVEVMASLHTVQADRMFRSLIEAGLTTDAVAAVDARLREVQTHGRITGEAWAGMRFARPATTPSRPTTTTTAEPPPDFVALNSMGPASKMERVAEFRLTADGLVSLTIVGSRGLHAAQDWYDRGALLLAEGRYVGPGDGPDFMRALVQPLRMSYYHVTTDMTQSPDARRSTAATTP